METVQRWARRVGLAGVVALWPWIGTSATAADPSPEPAEPSVLVATRPVEPGPYDVTLPVKLGLLEAGEHRTLAFDVPGRLAWRAEEGTRVEAGDPVARLEAALEGARARQAELRFRDAEKEVRRIRGLRRSRATSEKAMENAETQLALRASELEEAREQLRRRTLRAPFAGVVTETRMDPGEVAAAGVLVATLMDLDPLHLEVGVPGYQVTQVREGAGVRVEVPSLPAAPVAGVVARVADAAAEGRHLFRVEIHVPNGEGRLRPGMSARAAIVTRSLERALAIPQDLAVPRGDERVLFFADEGRARAVPVGASPLHGDRYVLEGSLPYRELVVRGQRDLRDGMAVRVDGAVLRGLAGSDGALR